MRFGHFVRTGQRHRVFFRGLPAQRVVEALQLLGNRGLQLHQFSGVLVDPLVIELTEHAQDVLQLRRVNALDATQLASQLRDLAGQLTIRRAVLADFLLRQRTAVEPSAPTETVPGAAAIEAAGEIAATTVDVALAIAEPAIATLAVLILTLSLSLALSLRSVQLATLRSPARSRVRNQTILPRRKSHTM